MTRYVVGLVFDEARDHVLLIHKRRPQWMAGKLNGIGGKVEASEGFRQAMERECAEESGLSGLAWEPVSLLQGPGFDVMFYAAFTQAVFYAIQKTDERLQVYPVRSLPEGRIMPNLPVMIALALDRSGIAKPVHLRDVVPAPVISQVAAAHAEYGRVANDTTV